MPANTATATRADQIDRYVELSALGFVLANSRCYNEVEYIETPRGLDVFDGPIFEAFDDALNLRADKLAHELWPMDVEWDKDPEWLEAMARASSRTGEVCSRRWPGRRSTSSTRQSASPRWA
jgi:hypothetical protein